VSNVASHRIARGATRVRRESPRARGRLFRFVSLVFFPSLFRKKESLYFLVV
jgi:hypothetical protein